MEGEVHALLQLALAAAVLVIHTAEGDDLPGGFSVGPVQIG